MSEIHESFTRSIRLNFYRLSLNELVQFLAVTFPMCALKAELRSTGDFIVCERHRRGCASVDWIWNENLRIETNRINRFKTEASLSPISPEARNLASKIVSDHLKEKRA